MGDDIHGEPDRPVEAGERRLVECETLLYDAPIAPRVRQVGGLVLDSSSVARQRGLQPSDILQCVAVLVVRLGMPGLQRNYTFIQRNGAVEVLRVICAGRLGIELFQLWIRWGGWRL